MKDRTRALRRHHEKRVQAKRWQDATNGWLKNSVWDSEQQFEEWKIWRLGRMRHNHSGCGCCMCKPWKHWNKPSRYGRASEMRSWEDAQDQYAGVAQLVEQRFCKL